MCGIIAVVSRPSGRPGPDPGWVTQRLAGALAAVPVDGGSGLVAALVAGAEELEHADAALRGPAGVRALLGAARSAGRVGTRAVRAQVRRLMRRRWLRQRRT